jgi:hypothetical protein
MREKIRKNKKCLFEFFNFVFVNEFFLFSCKWRMGSSRQTICRPHGRLAPRPLAPSAPERRRRMRVQHALRSGQVKCGHTPGRTFAIARPILLDNLCRGGVDLHSTVTMTLLLPFFVVSLLSPRIAAGTGPLSDSGLGEPAVPSGCDGLGLWARAGA